MTASAVLTEARALHAVSFDELLAEAVSFHGHLCPGQVLGVRMTLAGCREVGIQDPKSAGKRLVVFAEIDRCPTDAIQALTGVSLGKRTLKHLDYGKMAATFVDVEASCAVRIVARDDARARVVEWAPGVAEVRAAQTAAYRVMPEAELLRITEVAIAPGWLDRRRVRVNCARCGEGINYGREVTDRGQVVCRPCADETYWRPV
jgi:formylmethanofuran dehydrogenase subunit E